MQGTNVSGILVENTSIESVFLEREVKVDYYLPANVPDPSTISLLLVKQNNSGQTLASDLATDRKTPFHIEDLLRGAEVVSR